MRQLKKLLKPSGKKVSVTADVHHADALHEDQEIEILMIQMFRDLPADQRQKIFEIIAEFYSLSKRSA